MTRKRPNPTFMGWLGRQVGHVRKAIRARPAAPNAPRGTGAPEASPAPEDAAAAAAAEQPPQTPFKVVYRENRVEEAEMPDKPGVRLRRTIIDEVIVQPEQQPPTPEP